MKNLISQLKILKKFGATGIKQSLEDEGAGFHVRRQHDPARAGGAGGRRRTESHRSIHAKKDKDNHSTAIQNDHGWARKLA